MISIYLMALFNVDAFKVSGSVADLFRWKGIVLFAALFAFYKWKSDIHPIVLIVIAAVIGIIFSF